MEKTQGGNWVVGWELSWQDLTDEATNSIMAQEMYWIKDEIGNRAKRKVQNTREIKQETWLIKLN